MKEIIENIRKSRLNPLLVEHLDLLNNIAFVDYLNGNQNHLLYGDNEKVYFTINNKLNRLFLSSRIRITSKEQFIQAIYYKYGIIIKQIV